MWDVDVMSGRARILSESSPSREVLEYGGRTAQDGASCRSLYSYDLYTDDIGTTDVAMAY